MEGSEVSNYQKNPEAVSKLTPVQYRVTQKNGTTGANVPNATYRNHGSHVEAIEIIFDPAKISFRRLLESFFQIHAPTIRNRQDNDTGGSYRSVICYTNDEQKGLLWTLSQTSKPRDCGRERL